MLDQKRPRKNDAIASHIKEGLASLGAQGADELIDIVVDQTRPERLRDMAINVLGFLAIQKRLAGVQKTRATDALLRLLFEDRPRLAWGSATVLPWLDPPHRASSRLVEVVKSSMRTETRRAAVYSLSFIGDGRAAGQLVRILMNSKEKPTIRAEAAEALITCGPSSNAVISALVRGLSEKSPKIRFFSAYALGQYDISTVRVASQVIQALERLARDKADVRGYGSVGAEAATALRHVRSKVRSAKKHS